MAQFAKSNFTQLVQPRISKVMQRISSHITKTDRYGLVSNSIWAFTEIVQGSGQPAVFAEFLPVVLQPIVEILTSSSEEDHEHESNSDIRSWFRASGFPSMLRSNTALAISRLAVMYPAAVSQLFPDCVDGICMGLVLSFQGEEKDQAMEGLLSLVAALPSVVVASQRTLQLLLLAVYAHSVSGLHDIVSDYDDYADSPTRSKIKLSPSKYMVELMSGHGASGMSGSLFVRVRDMLQQLRAAVSAPAFNALLDAAHAVTNGDDDDIDGSDGPDTSILRAFYSMYGLDK